jgi:hypothetical protein
MKQLTLGQCEEVNGMKKKLLEILAVAALVLGLGYLTIHESESADPPVGGWKTFDPAPADPTDPTL